MTRTSLARTVLAQVPCDECERRPTGEHSPAEMLYLTVTLGTPGSRELFNDNEVGDTDDDGYFEFIDGWDRPIYFIRQAPAFAGSEVQLTQPVTPAASRPRPVRPPQRATRAIGGWFR